MTIQDLIGEHGKQVVFTGRQIQEFLDFVLVHARHPEEFPRQLVDQIGTFGWRVIGEPHPYNGPSRWHRFIGDFCGRTWFYELQSDVCECRTIFGFQGRAEGVSRAGCPIHNMTLAQAEILEGRSTGKLDLKTPRPPF